MKLPYIEFAGKFLPIGFSRRLGIGFNVVGQESIFGRFKICFDRSKKVVEFHPRII